MKGRKKFHTAAAEQTQRTLILSQNSGTKNHQPLCNNKILNNNNITDISQTNTKPTNITTSTEIETVTTNSHTPENENKRKKKKKIKNQKTERKRTISSNAVQTPI
jgi:hypothetical protein